MTLLMRHPAIDISKKAFNTNKHEDVTALRLCKNKPTLRTIMELGYFPEEDAFNNLIFLVNSAETLAANDKPGETKQVITNLKVVILLLDAITHKSDELLLLKIRALKLLVAVSKKSGNIENAKKYKNLLDRLKKK